MSRRGGRLVLTGPLAGAGRGQRTEVKPVAHVQLEPAVGVDVGPEQRGQGPTVGTVQAFDSLGAGEDLLKQQGADVDQGGLRKVQGEHEHLLRLLVLAGQVSAFSPTTG